MRIVHVSDCYPPRTGGIESQVHDLAAQQAGAGHAVHVLTATRAEDGSLRTTSDESTGVRVHRMASAVTFGVPVHPLGGRLVTRALLRLRPDVVHVHAGVVSPFANDGARAARALGLPVVITWHCMLTGAEWWVRPGARLTGWRDAPVALTAVSRVAADRVAAALGRDDVAVVTNGLDLTPWRAVAVSGTAIPSEADPEPGTASVAGQAPGSAVESSDADDGPRALRVVATQRLAPRKRSVALVRAVARAADELGPGRAGRSRIRLTIAGAGPEAGLVRREAERRGIGEAVTLLGRVDRADLPTLYGGQDVFLSAVELEAFGIAALEARAAGLIVVARRGTGITEFVVDGVDGLLGDDDTGLAESLVLLAADVTLRRQLHAHNRAVPPTADFVDVMAAAEREYARAAALVGR